MAFFLVRVAQLLAGGELRAEPVYWLWGTIVVLATAGTIGLTIMVHVLGGVARSTAAGRAQPVDHVTDERDALITLRGTEVAYRASSIGVALAMLTLVIGQPPLVMFTLLIFFGLLAQILADVTRLYHYRSGA
jgi:hypothetical protein